MYLALFNNLFYDEEFLKRLHLIGLQSEKGIYMMNQNQGLKRELKSRHIFMIALGGVIGTGLFRIWVYNS